MSITSLLSQSMRWTDDVASDMDIFSRLSKSGHHERAMRFFDEYLVQHASNFPVAAEYGAALVDQGAYGNAEAFLTKTLEMSEPLASSTAYTEAELSVVTLMLQLVRMHTTLLFEDVSLHIQLLTRDLTRLQALNQTELQAMLLRFQIIVLSSSERFPSPEKNSLDLPTTSHDQLHIPELGLLSVPGSSKMLLDMNFVWEARSFLSLCLGYKGIDNRSLSEDTWRLIDPLLENEDITVRLVGLTMLADLGNSLLKLLRIVPEADLQDPPRPAVRLAEGLDSNERQQDSKAHVPNASGQVTSLGMKPMVTANFWEDEGTLCFQVESEGICVARRGDNHMINGTKVLAVAGMERRYRDSMLKSEKDRHLMKRGPMHLRGVWLPFDRALDIANKSGITELLYPLFVHNIGAFLHHSTDQASQERRPSLDGAHALPTPSASFPSANLNTRLPGSSSDGSIVQATTTQSALNIPRSSTQMRYLNRQISDGTLPVHSAQGPAHAQESAPTTDSQANLAVPYPVVLIRRAVKIGDDAGNLPLKWIGDTVKSSHAFQVLRLLDLDTRLYQRASDQPLDDEIVSKDLEGLRQHAEKHYDYDLALQVYCRQAAVNDIGEDGEALRLICQVWNKSRSALHCLKLLSEVLANGNFWVGVADKEDAILIVSSVSDMHQTLVRAIVDLDPTKSDFTEKLGPKLMSLAAAKGRNDIVDILIELGNVDPDYKDDLGRTPLSWASGTGQLEIVRALLTTGAVDPNSKDDSGRTPLSWASEQGHWQTAQMLSYCGVADHPRHNPTSPAQSEYPWKRHKS